MISCSVENEKYKMDGTEILKKSIKNHDPNNKWNELEFSIHIQEPRIGNPSRYSILKLNNRDNSFELLRNRDSNISKHVIDKNGVSKIYLNDSEEIEEELVEKYRLKPERNKGYREFYRMMYGLPMSLSEKSVSKFGKVENCVYNNENCYKIPIELKEEMFSKNWLIYISEKEFKFKGMEIIFPEDPLKGEKLYFEGSISIQDIKIPRIRHWYELTNDEYSGSDIIMSEL